MSNRAGRAGQVALSLFAGLLIWEIAGWQFNSAFLAPLLGTGVPLVDPVAHWIAGLFGHTIAEEHIGALPRLVEFFGWPYIVEAYNQLQSEGGFFLWNAWRALFESDFVSALVNSFQLFITGLVLAMGFGLLLGLLMARLAWLRVALETYILALYATPMAALIPFILAIFGFFFWPKVLVVFLFAVFPVLYNTLEGARSLKQDFVEVARSFRTSEYRLWRDVIVPYTFPFALTGLRQGVGRALVGMVAAEILLNPSGLGGWLMDASRSFDMAGVLAAVCVVTVLGTVMMGAVRRVEDRFAKWRGNSR